jgi:hypothetical protein
MLCSSFVRCASQKISKWLQYVHSSHVRVFAYLSGISAPRESTGFVSAIAPGAKNAPFGTQNACKWAGGAGQPQFRAAHASAQAHISQERQQ